ncbi:MAG: DNA methyltransferase [Candidatus Bathyarchaeia archaeon]
MDQQFTTSAFNRVIEAQSHTPVYTMHKYFARRPWNVFRELISHYTTQGEIVLDPFCGGGVTVVEALKLGRKVIGVDVNALATYVTSMEVRPVDIEVLEQAFNRVRRNVRQHIMPMYKTTCSKCKAEAFADWLEWDEPTKQILRLKYECPACAYSSEKRPTEADSKLAQQIEKDFDSTIDREHLSFPRTPIPPGDKTNSLRSQNVNYFSELFTKRNLLALAILRKEIDSIENTYGDFLRFVFSSSLKWASRQSHLRGEIVEGWALHAYWIYPKSLEINVWNTFERRWEAVKRGKRYSNRTIEACRFAESFEDLTRTRATCLILTHSSAYLPLPDESVDTIVTDPPYGGNVNYGELSDYWTIWFSDGKLIDKRDEVIVNKTQAKKVEDYESLLYSVFKECYRVLKNGRCLVSTFNSRDLRIVASFVVAASKAGFVLHPEGLLYQKPIRAYTTTFHAMQIGAFVGDFVFTFKKKKQETTMIPAREELRRINQYVKNLVNEEVSGGIAEPQVREKAYRALIPFLAKYAGSDTDACRSAVEFFEGEIRRQDEYFKNVRARITSERRRAFLSRKREPRSNRVISQR